VEVADEDDALVLEDDDNWEEEVADEREEEVADELEEEVTDDGEEEDPEDIKSSYSLVPIYVPLQLKIVLDKSMSLTFAE